MIITDHHSVPECIPEEAIAILSPKLRDTPYPYRDLSGSGMAFKLLSAIAQGLEPEKYRDILSRYIDFATLGTIADMMPLTGENRTIVKLGLAQITQSESPALRTLIEGKNTRSADVVGFHIGPRINAAGRMESAYTALHLLLSGSSGVAKILAEIEDMNLRRRATTTHFTELALSEIDPTQPLIVFRSDEIDHGILGLVAGRIAEEHQKPTIVAREEGGRIVGSARSPKSVHITELFETEKSRFVAFGGHAQAAGFTVESSNFESLISALRTTLTERNAGKGIPVSEPLMIDRILDLGDLTLSLVETIESVGPYGIGFPKPLFAL